MAEGSANIWGIQLSGKDTMKQPFVYTFFGSGGTGARPTKDGLSATAFPSGVLGTPVEVVETLAPLLVERKALRDGSGGDGRFRGGLGQVLGFRVLTDDPATCSVFCDRTVIPAQGFFGGGPGATGALLINGRAPENPKAEQTLRPGDLIELFMPGGGGYGPPAERDPTLRARDRLESYTTA
jgi:N-methylhydantoinase B